MRRISHDTYATVFAVVYLGVVTNALLLVSSLPLVLLLVTTDPLTSWPLIAIAAPDFRNDLARAWSKLRASL